MTTDERADYDTQRRHHREWIVEQRLDTYTLTMDDEYDVSR